MNKRLKVNVMNSEITNVSKLSSVTVVKTDKPSDSGINALLNGNNVTTPTPDSNQNEKEHGKSPPSLDSVKKAAEQGNSLLQAANRSLHFQIDDSTKRMIVKIVDNETGKVVRQIPSEEMLDFVKRMQALDGHKGAVLQDRA